MTDIELQELLKRAKAAFESLTPERQSEHRFEQKVNWVFGELKLRGCGVTEERVRELVRKWSAE